MAKLHPAHVGLTGSSAQIAAIRRRVGERVKSDPKATFRDFAM